MLDNLLSADLALLDLLRQHQALTVAQLATELGVTATAVRQRLARLMSQQLIVRTTIRAARGRPSHHYELTEAGRRKTGENFADLSVALWQEIRAIPDPDVRRGLLHRISCRLAAQYASQCTGESVDERLQSLSDLFSARRIPMEVDRSQGLPVLRAQACPYPGLAEQDRGVCAMERMMFQETLGCDVKLNECRLDGDSCCTFEVRAGG